MNSLYRLYFITLFVKVLVAYFLPLSFDEAYYWVWSHHLQLSYFDHPPFVSWLYLAGQPLEGFGNLIRLPGILMSHATLWIWLKILEPYFNKEQLFWWLLLGLLTPLFGMGGLVITPDIPLMFFWSLSVWQLIRCRNNPTLQNFALLGSVLGLGFLAKYHIVVFIPLGFIWLFKERVLKKELTLPILWSIVWFLIFSFPVFYWNYLNDFISFKFQLGHGLSESHWTPWWPTKFVLDQVLIVFPTLLFLILQKKTSPPHTLLKIMAWGPLIFFFAATFKADSEANWPIAGYPALLALAILDVPGRKLIKATLVLWGILFTVVSTEAIFHWLPGNTQRLKTSEFRVLDPLVAVLQKDKELRPVYAYSFQMASKLSYEMKEPIYKLYDLNRKDFFDFREESKPTSDVFYVALEKGVVLPKWVKEKGFQIVRTYGVDDRFELVKVEAL